MGSLRGSACTPEVSPRDSIPTGFLQPEVMRTYLPGTGTLVGGPSVGLGLLAPEISLLNFYPPHVNVGLASSASLPLLPVWMNVVSSVL